MSAYPPLPLTIAEVPQLLLAALIVLFVAISFIMILVVLIQKPQGGGLSGAFGASADGAGQTAFGAKTGDVLTLVTVGVFVVFLVIAGVLNLIIEPTLPPDPNDTVQSNGTTPQAPGLTGGEPGTTIDLAVDADGNITEANMDQPSPQVDQQPAPETEEDYTPLGDQPAPVDPGSDAPGTDDGR